MKLLPFSLRPGASRLVLAASLLVSFLVLSDPVGAADAAGAAATEKAPVVENSISYDEAFEITLAPVPEGTRHFTTAELSKFVFKDEDNPTIYLAILGRVYEVTAGKEFYAPGEKYDWFGGRDASPSYATGEFNQRGQDVSLDDLSNRELKSIYDWFLFYHGHGTYKFLGILAGGIFYDENGVRGPLLESVVDRVKVITSTTAQERIKKREERLKRRAEKQRIKAEKEAKLKMLEEKRAAKEKSEL